MQFAPAQDVDYVDPVTGYRLRSLRSQHTEVLAPDGSSVWSARLFTGYAKPALSPDGQYLVASAGLPLHLETDDELATVYCCGALVRTVVFSDLFAKSARVLARERGIHEMGGGWVDRAGFLRFSVDWSAGRLVFKLYTGETRTFGLERERHRPTNPTEAALFDQLRSQPSDDGARGVYADWLEQAGFATRARLVRANTTAVPKTEAADHPWRSVVSRVPIDQCRQDGCPKQWSALGSTPHDGVRRCTVCHEHVYYCATKREVTAHADADRRIAIDAALDRRHMLKLYEEQPTQLRRSYEQSLPTRTRRDTPADPPRANWLDGLDDE